MIESRPLAVAVMYLLVLAVLGGAGASVRPRLATEVQSLAQQGLRSEDVGHDAETPGRG